MSIDSRSRNSTGSTVSTVSNNESPINNWEPTYTKNPYVNFGKQPSKTEFTAVLFDGELSPRIEKEDETNIEIVKDDLFTETVLNGLQKAKENPSGKSPTFWDIHQYKENIFATNILRTLKIKNFIEESVKIELEAIDSIHNSLVSNLINTSFTNTQNGGHDNPELNRELVIELNRKEGDSIHDFKPSTTRNNAFPDDIIGHGKLVSAENGKTVLARISKILENSEPKTTLLYDYFNSSPLHFEENIKVDYLLYKIAGELTDINYYFTEGTAIPTTWIEERKRFFGPEHADTINSLEKLNLDIEERGIDYWLFDAVMSGRIKKQVDEHVISGRFVTLANIWDPAPSKNPPFNELTEYILSNSSSDRDKSVIVVEPTIKPIQGYTIYDWRDPRTGNSYYDMVYDELINRDILSNQFGLILKMRLAVNSTNDTSVALCLYQNDRHLNTYILKGGFSVNELAMGMHYIEKNHEELHVGKKVQHIHPILKELIDDLKEIVQIPNSARGAEFFTNEFYKLLLRFKSSGDHGQGNTVKIINTLIGKNTLFMSGDNLAFVYTIASEIPTLGNYYKAPRPANCKGKKGNDDDEDDDDDDDEETASKCEIPQFIVGYFPMKETKEKYEKLINCQISVIGSLQMDVSEYKNPNYLAKAGIASIDKAALLELKATLERLIIENEVYIDSALKPLSDEVPVLQNTKLTRQNDIKQNATDIEKITELKTRINSEYFAQLSESIKAILPILEAIPNSSDNLFKTNDTYDFKLMINYVKLITEFTNGCFFIKNYINIVQLVKSSIKNMLDEIGNVVGINDISILQGETSRGRTTQTRLNTQVNNLTSQFKEYKITNKTASVDKELLLELALRTQSKRENLSEDLSKIYSKLVAIKKALTEKMTLDLHLDRSSYTNISNKIDSIRGLYLERIRGKIQEVEDFGPALNEYFDKCFGYTTSGNALSELFFEDNSDGAEVMKSVSKSIEEVRTTKIPVETESSGYSDLLSESVVTISESLPEVPYKQSKKTGRNKNTQERVVDKVILSAFSTTEFEPKSPDYPPPKFEPKSPDYPPPKFEPKSPDYPPKTKGETTEQAVSIEKSRINAEKQAEKERIRQKRLDKIARDLGVGKGGGKTNRKLLGYKNKKTRKNKRKTRKNYKKPSRFSIRHK